MKKEWVNYLPVNFTYVNCSVANGEIVFSRTSSTGAGSGGGEAQQEVIPDATGDEASMIWLSEDGIAWADGENVAFSFTFIPDATGDESAVTWASDNTVAWADSEDMALTYTLE